MPSSIVLVDRAVLRERDRRSRARRKARLTAMRETLAALERAAPVMLTLDGDNVEWDGFLDDRAMRVRSLMRKTLRLTEEAAALQSTQWQLQRLLREHRIASQVLAGLVESAAMDDLEIKVEHWRRLTREHFTPWTRNQCTAEIAAALAEIDAMLQATDAQSTGVRFLGWSDRRHIDAANYKLSYVFHKEFHSFDMADSVDKLWRVYTSAEAFQQIAMGDHARGAADLVQHLSPTTMIVRLDERYPAIGTDVHDVCLLFRVETSDGVVQCLRSIAAPALEHAITCNGPSDPWGSNCIWFKWEKLSDDDDAQDFRIYAGGSMAESNLQYANWWLVEVLASVIRCEQWVVQRPLLKLS